MVNARTRGEMFFANTMHRDIFLFVFLICFIFMSVTTLAVHYVIFNIASQQFGVPKAVAYYVFPTAQKITLSLSVILPLLLLFTLYFTSQIAQRIVGPFNRILRELEQNLSGERKGSLVVRKNDRFAPLIEKINALIEKIESQRNPQ